MTQPNLLGLCGSLRAGSMNRKLMHEAARAFGDATFAEVIHGDAWSQCHVMPSGNGDAARAVAAIERLPIILDALANVYDLIVIECGPTDAKGIRRVENQTSEVVLSVINPQDEAVTATAGDLVAAGHGELMIADAGRTGKASVRGRSAA